MATHMFCLVFDEWSSGSTHYVAVYDGFPSKKSMEYKYFLQVFGPYEN